MAIIALLIYALSTLQFADSLFDSKDYFNAISEYKRAIYLGDRSNYALWKIALSYENRRKYGFAAKYFGELAFYDDEIFVKHHLAYNLIRTGRYREAELVLEGQRDSVSKVMYAVAKGLYGDFKVADSILHSMNIAVPSLPDDRILRYPSYIFPGFGFFVLKDIRRGLLSLFFTAGTGYLTYYFVRKRRYPEAIFTFNTLFFRFYTGNINSALLLKKKKKLRFYKSLIERYRGF